MGRRIEQQAVNRERMDRRGRRRLEERGQVRNTGAAKHRSMSMILWPENMRRSECTRRLGKALRYGRSRTAESVRILRLFFLQC